MTILVTLTTAGTDSGPFNLYTELDGYVTPFESGVSKLALTTGYTSTLVPDLATIIRIKSAGVCTNYIDLVIGQLCNTLHRATNFAILAASTITNTGATVITGDLGLYAGTSVTGFPPGIVIGTQHITDTQAADAQTDANAAFVALNSLVSGGLLPADIGGTTVLPGIYNVASSLAITGTLILDGGGNPDAVFIFQIPTTFIPAVGSSISLINGADAGNVYWAVGSSATLSVNSVVVGNIIALASITLNTGATLTGKAFALTGAVTLDTNSVTNINCTINPLV